MTITLLLTDTTGIVNIGNILADGRDERNTWRKNRMNFNNCRFIHADNMILLKQT